MSVHYVPAKAGGRAPTPDILGAVLTGESQNVTETAEIMSGLAWDYTQAGDNAEAVIEHTVEIKRSERRASEAIIEAGKHLVAVKELLPHGAWESWLAAEFTMSDRTAQRMMAVATKFVAKSDTVSLLTPSVLYLLAGDSVPEEAREEVVRRSQAGETVTKAVAKAVIEEHRPAVQPKPLTQEQIGEFLAHYWRSTNLQAVADSVDPFSVLRRIMVSGQPGGADNRWRFHTSSGTVRCWVGGSVVNREPDAVWSYDQFARLSLSVLPEPTINTAPAPVVVDVVDEVDGMDADGGGERPVTAGMRAAQRAIWNWLVDQCGAASFKEIVDLAEALHFQEDSHPLWFRMYPQGADIDDVFWALEACIDQAAAAVPEYAQQTAAFVPTANLKAAVIYWLREAYPDYYGQVAALQCMIADPMHDEDVQRMEPTLPAPYRKDDLLVAMMQASAYLDSLADDEPEEGRGAKGEEENGQLSTEDHPAARRMNRLHTLKVRFQETIDLLPEFGVLTGHFVDTNPAKRALHELIEVLESEMDALAKGVKAEG